MRLEQLGYVLEIGRCGSITQAAARLHLTQPALSESISNLEEELGFALFHRSRQGVEWTSQGRELSVEIEKVLDIIAGWKRFAVAAECLENSVNVAYTASTSAFLTRIAAALAEEKPPVQVCFYECVARSFFDDLENGGHDMGISGIVPEREADYAAQAARRGWHLEFLYEDSFHIMVSGKNPLAAKSSLCAADLNGLKLAMLPGHYETVAMKYFKPFFTQEYPCYLNDRGSIMQLVAADEAVAVFPRVSMKDTFQVREGQVKPMPLQECPLPIRFYLVTRPDARMTDAERNVADVVRRLDFWGS